MRITPRKRSMVKEPVAPPVQEAAVLATTVREGEKPQPIIKPMANKIAKVEKYKSIKAEER